MIKCLKVKLEWFILFLTVSIVWICTWKFWCLWKLEALKPPAASVLCGCETLNVDDGTQTWVLWKSNMHYQPLSRVPSPWDNTVWHGVLISFLSTWDKLEWSRKKDLSWKNDSISLKVGESVGAFSWFMTDVEGCSLLLVGPILGK